MTARVVFTRGARAALQSLAAYIARDHPKRARSFVAQLRSRLEKKLSAFPDSGPVIGRYRYMAVGQYVAIYRTDDGSIPVRVIMITEGHRDWRRMIEDLS